MSVSSVGSSNQYSYLQKLFQPDGADAGDEAAPTQALQALYQAFSGGGANDPPGTGECPGDGGASSSGAPQFSSGIMQTLLAAQGEQGASGSSRLQSLKSQFDGNGDGEVSEAEFESAIGPDADPSSVAALFNKLDGNGDGSVSADELQSALQKAHGGHRRHHPVEPSAGAQGGDPLKDLLSGASADGATSQSATNTDGSTTTTITYGDGTKVEMTVPASSASDTASNAAAPNPNALSFSNLLKQLIGLQAELAAPTTNLSV